MEINGLNKQKSLSDFNLPPRYQFQRILGKGSYGVVAQYLDQLKNEQVAIKKMPFLLKYHTNSEAIIETKKLLRELKVLNNFRHPNLIELKHALIQVEDGHYFIFMVIRLMDADLQKVIKKSHLGDAHIQYIMYQIFLGLNYLHSGNVIHRDLKPNNILATENCEIALCDFGFAREEESVDNGMTEYVVTRIYRAPEIILCPKHYAKAVDIWAIGCTFYELLTKSVLFKALDYKELICQMIKILGKPSQDELGFISKQSAKNFIGMLEYSPPNKASSRIADYPNKMALDLLDKCITFDPTKRISAIDALKDPYFSGLYEEKDVTFMNKHVDFSFETNQNISLNELTQMIVEEVRQINKTSNEIFDIPSII